MNNSDSFIESPLLRKEQDALSKTIVISLVNIVAQQHNAYKPSGIIPPSLANEICSTDLNGIDSLIKNAKNAITFENEGEGFSLNLSFKKIERILKDINNAKNQRSLLITYLERGASSLCLHDMFRISKTQTISLRKQYKITATSCGRQDLEEIDTARLEYESSATDDVKQDLLRISEKLNIPLNTVWHAVRNQPETKKNSHPKKGVKYA